MKKLSIILVGGIAAIVALSLLGPLLALAFTGLLVFLGMHYYVKSKSTIAKVWWIVVGLIGIFASISNVPALVGLGAIFLIYVLYKKWNNEDIGFKKSKIIKEDDPFTNFETEWANLTK